MPTIKENLNKRLFRNTLNFGLGSFLPKVIGFFLIPVYTNYLTPEDFGMADMATSFGMFLLVFMRLGIPGSVTRFYYDHREGESLQNYVTTIFWFLLGCSVVVGAITWVVLRVAGDVILPGLPFYPFVLMIIAWAFFHSNTDLQRRLLQVREQSAYSARLSTFTALLTISLTILFVVVLGWGAVGVVGATVVSAIVFFVQAQIYLHPDLKGRFRFSDLTPSFTYALGILPYHLINNASPIINKSILSAYDSLAAVGILGIAIRFTIPLSIFVGALQSSFTPMYFSIRKDEGDSADGKKQIGELMSNIWVIALLLLAALVCFGELAIKMLTTEKFHEAATLLPYLCISLTMGLAAYIFGNEIYYSKKTGWIGVLAMINVGVNVLLLIILFPRVGLVAVAYAMMISSMVTGIIQIYISRKLYQFYIPWKALLRSGCLIVALFVIQNFIDVTWVWWLQAIASGLLFSLFISLLFYFHLLKLNRIPLLNKFLKSRNEQ